MNDRQPAHILRHFLQCLGICLALLFVEKLGIFLHAKLLIAPFGASCAILFCLAESPVAHPRNVLGGYCISLLVGTTIAHFWGNTPWSIALAVSISIFLMLVTGAMHPPAGAIPIIVLTSTSIWTNVALPVLIGTLLITALALLHGQLLRRLHPPANPR